MRIAITHPLSQLKIDVSANSPTEMRIFWQEIVNVVMTDIATIKFQNVNAVDPSLNEKEDLK